ncbi:MAG TPA: hypothetical protein VK139_03775, partial [Microbacteriaceae bacterium]|nr:hypothetical protein [Microbacteriaceae bacterium]
MLMVTMVLGLALVLTVGSYVTLTMGALQSADRSFHYNTAFNLAEAGVEEALWALNHNDWTKRTWTESGSDRILTGSLSSSELTSANSIRGYFNVFVSQAAGGTPVITAEAVVRPVLGSEIRKQIRVNASNANIFMPPFTAITKLDLNGGEIDSYRMADGDYTTAERRYETTVASPTINIGNVDIGSPADIYGYVTVGVGTENSSTFLSSIKGSVTGETTQSGQDGVLTAGGNLVDTNRVAFDFVQDFPLPAAPTEAFTDAVPAADSNGMIVLGDPTGATTKRYQFSSNFKADNGTTILIVGPVEIKTLAGFDIPGQAQFTVLTGTYTTPNTTQGKKVIPGTEYTATNASATIYAYGDLAISGNGALIGGTIPGSNISTDPTKLQVFGMSTTAQNFSVGGNGNLAAAIYAPNADVKFNGGGSSGYFAGATVANNITVNGNGYRVRFPEEMANMNTATTYRISRWVELTNRSTWHQ